jgi:flavin reductase (DIM6/NTAB) family NADH-FMN oxidoreductase RutF
MYKIIIGAVVPRPIAFVSTCNSAGVGNLAPYSFFNGLSSKPACVMISVGVSRSDGTQKDTLRNILETEQFVINSANEWMIESVVHCAGNYPYGVDEMQEVGLTPLDSMVVQPKRVKESAVQLECQLYNTMQIGDGSPGSSTLVVGQIVMAHVYSEAYSNGRIDFEKIKSVARLGGFGYGLVTELFDIPVPVVEK